MKDKQLRDHLVNLLNGAQTRITFDRAINDFPYEIAGMKDPNMPYTAWQILEHLRILQWDVYNFSFDPSHISPSSAEGYWPANDSPANLEEWERSIAQFKKELDAMKELIMDPNTDLYTPIPHGTGQTVLREALVLGEHNAYHIGQLMVLKKYYTRN